MEVTIIAPESLEVANCYLQYGNIKAVAAYLGVGQNIVVEHISRPEVRRYLDNVYLDLGYRNKDAIASVMDEIIASKMSEAMETGIYTKKDLVDLLELAHKMRMDELKHMHSRELALDKKEENIRNQVNIQINDSGAFGSGNYGKLMERLLETTVE